PGPRRAEEVAGFLRGELVIRRPPGLDDELEDCARLGIEGHGVLLRRHERLLLEEVVEAAADVAGACRVGRGIALDRHAERERGALVPRVLVGHALLNRLRTLEAPAGVEVRALAARVDRDAAVRALLERRRGDRQDGAARATPGDGVLGQHPTTSRSVGRRRRRRRRRPLRLTPLVPISLLSIFSVGHARGPFRSLTLPDAVAGAPVA